MTYKKSRWVKDIITDVEEIKELFTKNNIDCEVCGPIRRECVWVQSIILVVKAPMPEIIDVLKQVSGITFLNKMTVRKRVKFLIDDLLYMVISANNECWGAVLLYYTGTRIYNERLSRRAKWLGMRLTARGLFQGGVRIAGRTEEQIFNALGMDYRPPQKRRTKKEVNGEIIFLREVKKFGF